MGLWGEVCVGGAHLLQKCAATTHGSEDWSQVTGSASAEHRNTLDVSDTIFGSKALDDPKSMFKTSKCVLRPVLHAHGPGQASEFS